MKFEKATIVTFHGNQIHIIKSDKDNGVRIEQIESNGNIHEIYFKEPEDLFMFANKLKEIALEIKPDINPFNNKIS